MRFNFYKITMILILGLVVIVLSCREDEFVPLKINSVSPNEVLIGDTISLSGEGFSPDYKSNAIFFEGVNNYVNPISGSNLKKLLVVVPDSTHSGSIRVNILDEEIFDSPSLVIKAPLFESISPKRAFAGDTILITGENFRSDKNRNNVRFHNPQNTLITAEVIRSTSTELSVIVPEYAQPGNISVLGYQGPKFNFDAGYITKLVPDHGIVGDTITLIGAGLVTDAAVDFGPDGHSNQFKLEGNTSRMMRVVVPSGARNGKIKLKYTIGGNETVIVSDSTFKVYPSITDLSSSSGPPGSNLTIIGHSFAPKATGNVVSVTISEKPTKVLSFDNNNIMVTIPVGATDGRIKINVNGRVAEGPQFQVTAPGSPVIESLSVYEGKVGDVVTIIGQNFGTVPANNTVMFATNKTATVLTASATALTVKVPEGAVTGKISVSSNGSAVIEGPEFTVKVVVIDFNISSISPTSLQQAQTLTINGSNFNADNGNIGVCITETFGQKNTYLLLTENTTITSTKITAKVEAFSDPSNGFPRKIFEGGDYKVSIRYLLDSKTPKPEDASNTRILKIQTASPVIESITPSERYPGETAVITGRNFDGSDNSNTVTLNGSQVDIVTPDDGNPSTIGFVVPDIAPGIYGVTLTTAAKTSNTFSFKVLEKVVSTDPIKPVYFLGAGSGSAVVVNKIATSSTTPTTIFTAPEGLTAMVVDIGNSKVYFSEKNSSVRNNDGIFKMNFDGTAKVKLINTPFNADNEVSYGYLVSDLTLDASRSKILWSAAPSTVDLLYGKTNDDPIKAPIVLTSLDSKFYLAGCLTIEPGTNTLYFTASFDDDATGSTFSQVFSLDLSGSNEPQQLFTGFAGFIFDVKIDATRGEIYMLTLGESGSTVVMKGNLNGSGSLEEFKNFGTTAQIFGIALDLKDQYLYWSQFNSGKGSIVRKRFDGGTIPGTDVQEQTVYDNLVFSTGTGAGAIAVHEEQGGASQRMGLSLNMQLKYHRPLKRK